MSKLLHLTLNFLPQSDCTAFPTPFTLSQNIHIPELSHPSVSNTIGRELSLYSKVWAKSPVPF